MEGPKTSFFCLVYSSYLLSLYFRTGHLYTSVPVPFVRDTFPSSIIHQSFVEKASHPVNKDILSIPGAASQCPQKNTIQQPSPPNHPFLNPNILRYRVVPSLPPHPGIIGCVITLPFCVWRLIFHLSPFLCSAIWYRYFANFCTVVKIKTNSPIFSTPLPNVFLQFMEETITRSFDTCVRLFNIRKHIFQ